MITPGKSCGVAQPTQRNCATHETSATQGATRVNGNGPKPASIQALRAQLRAQQGRNAAIQATDPTNDRVAHGLAGSSGCGVAVSRYRNRATTQLGRFALDECATDHEATLLARLNNMAFEFMAADGMEFDEAIRIAAEIVANCAVAACEASYEDVQALWRRIGAAGTAQAP